MIAEKINISTMIMVTSAMVRLRPINLTSMAMEDAHTAEADSEKAMALPMLRSVYCMSGLRKIISVPLHTYSGMPITVITIVDQGSSEKFSVSRNCLGLINAKIKPSRPAARIYGTSFRVISAVLMNGSRLGMKSQSEPQA